MSKQLVVQCSRMVLVFDEGELIKALSLDMLRRAISRGKGYKRTATSIKRQSQGFDRWQLYEVLKGNRYIDESVIHAVEIMPVVELREGITEYFLSQRNTGTE